jgi:DNA repair protein RecO (recombination protein O)
MAREDIKARALVLRVVDLGEHDRALSLLLEGHGKRGAIAKGAQNSKKRFAGALDHYRLLQAHYTERGEDKMILLQEAKVEEDFPGLEASFNKLAVASWATELTRELLKDGEGGEEIFKLLLGYYQQLTTCEDVPARLEADLCAFSLMLLAAAGFAPSLARCYRTGRPVSESRTWRFALGGEGALHPEARHQGERTLETTREVLEAMEALAYGYPLAPSDVPEAALLRRTRPLLHDTVKALLGKELKAAQFLKMVLG